MRHTMVFSLCLLGALGLSACDKSGGNAVDRKLQDLNVIDDSNLGDVMLTAADPEEAVRYFKRTANEKPDRIDLKRGLAESLIRAKRPVEAAVAWKAVVAAPGSTEDDQVGLADAQIRSGDWAAAEATLNAIPPTHETYQRYRLEAMVADGNKEWKKSDSFYETALGLTTEPAGVLNNWGFSKLSRGDFSAAERLFGQALQQDPSLFTAKNNLVLARSAQGNYSLPVMDMTQVERAKLTYTAALSAIKRGDVEIGKGLLRDAIETNPQHFVAAARSLEALESNVAN